MVKLTRALAVVPALVLAACFGAPRYQATPQIVVPASVSSPYASVTVASRPPAKPFLRELRDTTLEDLMLESQRANNDARTAEARLDGARAARRLASLDLLPTVTATGSATRQQQSMAVVSGLGRQLPQQELWDVGFDASWEVDVFGRVARNVRAQQALVSSAEYGLDDVHLSVMAEVARSYFELRGAQQQLAVSQRSADNQRRIVKLTEQRLAAGRGTAFDTERAKSVLYLTLSATPVLEAQIAFHRQRIAQLLGRTSDALPTALLTPSPLPVLPDTIYTGSTQELVRRRPDVRAAERQLAAETMLVGAARAEYLPRLALGARAGYVANTFDGLTRTGTSRLIAGPVLSFPLFDLARVNQRVELARSFENEAEAQHRTTVLRAVNESQAALVAYDRAHARLAILSDAVASSTRAADLAQQRFEAGLTDFLQVLDAQRTLLEAENQLAAGHTTAATALVAFYKAVGGSWPVR